MGMKMGTNYFLFSVSLPDVVLCCQVIVFVESCLNIKEEISRGSTPVGTKHYRSSTTTTKKRNCYLRGFEYVRKLGFEASGQVKNVDYKVDDGVVMENHLLLAFREFLFSLFIVSGYTKNLFMS